MQPKIMQFIPGPWYVAPVTRDDAGNLFNAVRRPIPDTYNAPFVESNSTPTHSKELAYAHASDLNRRYHEAHRCGVPPAVARWV